MIKLGEGTFVSYILGKRIKIISLDNEICRLYINDEYKGKCDLAFILTKVNSLENNEQDIRGLMKDEKELYAELNEIIRSKQIPTQME
ncbi:hypothetical protein ABFG93_12930 [Pseudalkalibacillus hwajinpoensis]|uniref:hypothetical protein n=1 Tax=Guptibacillus hwajinpoensis TaxID=208199 RepID=UPI00325C24C1